MLESLTEQGFDFAEWKEKSDSVGGNLGRKNAKGKGKDGKGRKGKKGRRDRDYRDPDDPLYETVDGRKDKTGANVIEVK